MAANGPLQIVVAAACWGTTGVAGRLAGGAGAGPLTVASARTVVAAVVLGALALVLRVPPLPSRRGARAGAVGVGLLLGGYQIAYFAAVAQAGVVIATLVTLGVSPVLVAVGAPMVGDARAGVRTWAALALAVTGLGLLVAGADAAVPAGGSVALGIACSCGSAAGFATVNLWGRTLADVPPLRLLTVAFAVAGVLQLPLLVVGVGAVDARGLLLLGWVGVVPTAFAYVLFFRGVATVAAPVAALLTLVEPVTAAVLAALLVGERLDATGVAGLVTVLLGIVVSAVPARAPGAARLRRHAPRRPRVR